MQVDFQEVLQRPLKAFGQAPEVLVPALIAGLVNLAIDLINRSAVAFVLAAFGSFVTFVCLAWGTLLLAKYLQGEEPDVLESWRSISERAPNIVITAAITALVVAFGAHFFVVLGVLLEAILIMSMPHAARENVTFDKALPYALRFALQGLNFLVLLLYVAVAFGLAFIPYAGAVVSNIFLIVWVSHLYLTLGQKFVDRPA